MMTTALILHPSERDAYGLLTRGLLTDLHTLAMGFQCGWERHRELAIDACLADRPPRYADLRDFLLSEVDVPPYFAQAVALWMTREEGNVDGFFLSFPAWTRL